MDDALLKSLGQIAGIGGIALGVVLLIFKAIIGKASGAKGQASNDSLLTTLAFLITLVGLAGIGAWVWVSAKGGETTRPSSQNISKDGGVILNGTFSGPVTVSPAQNAP
jgi:hypothetical protein